MDKLSLRKFRDSATKKGWKSLLKGTIYLIIALVSFYGDGVFVWMNIGHYTGSLAIVFQIFLVLGAFCTSASIMCLLFGKSSWFTPGLQENIAYVFTGVEVLVNLLNIIVALNANLGIVDLWRIFSPATPFVALIGWVVILQVDKEQLARHKRLEMEEEKEESEREYEAMVHEANMDLKVQYLEQTRQRLQQELNSPSAQQIIAQHAQNLTASVLNEITGLPVIPQQPTTQLPPITQHPSVQQHLSQQVMSSPLPASLENMTAEQRALYDVMFKHFMEASLLPLPALPPKQQNPLQSPQLDTASQPGSQNGNGNGHQKSQV